MPIYVVLLRGVNVGKAKRVPMAEFKALLLELGCTSATTLLNSGNAVVDAPHQLPATLAAKVSAALDGKFGFSVPVVVQPASELSRIVAECELSAHAADPSHLLVVFSQVPATLQRLQPIAAMVHEPERWAFGTLAAYLHCAAGILESKAADALLGKHGKAITTRNWATVLKLHALATKCAAERP